MTGRPGTRVTELLSSLYARKGASRVLPFILVTCLSSQASAEAPTNYILVWSDEFSKDGLPDKSKWSYDTEANSTGWYNNELQYYAAERLENAAVSEGQLNIVARKESLAEMADYGGQKYSSARLISRGKFSFTYGFVEMRAKLPCQKGMWPAGWMLGETGNWPDAGEIDFMEHVASDPGKIFGTVHTRATAGTSGDGASFALDSACNAFNLYQMEWTNEEISFAVNGTIYHTVKNRKTGAEQWPFDKPQYLLLNLAVGGDWPGDPEDGSFPATYSIDYVRVFQRGKQQ